MYKVKRRPWPEIARFYRSMATEHGHEWLTPMLKLVEQIQTADYVRNVYGSTSHVRLRISYLPEFDPDKEVLNVDFNRASGQFEFEYQESASRLYKRWNESAQPTKHFPCSIAFCN